MKQYTLFILGLIFFFACSRNGAEVDEPIPADSEDSNTISFNQEQLSGTNIITGELEKRSFSETLKCSGNIEPTPQGLAHISSPYGGFISGLDRYIGEEVKKGEVLLTLKNPVFIEIQENYLTTQSELKYLEKEYVRQRELNKDNASSAKEFEMAEANFLKAEAKYLSMKAKLNLLGLDPEKISENGIRNQIFIKSPINGFISEIHGNIGKYILPEDIILEITDPGKLHLHLQVFEKDISKIIEGQQVMFSTLAEPEKVYSAKIFSLGHTINSNDHTVTVHAKLERYDKNLIPGLFINAQIEISSDSLYAIPREGLIMGEENSYIFISKSGSYSQVPVKTGLSDENYFSIINPSQNILNHPVVLKGAYFINAAIEGSEEE